MPAATNLSRRERQIMDILYRLGTATAAEIRTNLPEAPSYSTVRALLRILEEKGHLKHHYDGPRYVFTPVVSRPAAQKSALRQMVRTFFFVWQQNRSGFEPNGQLVGLGDLFGGYSSVANNFFAVKANFWIPAL